MLSKVEALRNLMVSRAIGRRRKLVPEVDARRAELRARGAALLW